MNFLEDFIFKPIRKKFNIQKLPIFVFIVRNFLAVMKCVLFLFKSNLENGGIPYAELWVLAWLGYYFWKKVEGEFDQFCVNF